MAEKDNVYGGLGQIKNLYSDLYDRAAGATSAAGLGLFGLGSDIAGIIADNLNYDNFAKERMADAKNLRGRALDQLKGGFFGGDIRNPSKPVRMFGEDMTFADTFGERAEAKEQSVQEMLNELNQNAGLPDMGPVDTSKIKESNQSKAEAEASLQSEADQEQLFDNKLSADRASEKEASVADLQKEVTDNQEVATQQGFSNAMEDYLRKAGKGKSATGTGGSGARSLEDYKKEFAKATGIDIKGGPDKSNFLMALGLGLMQNRAGKGFDVSKILTSVGKATETAMPKLEEAKKQFKAEQLAAGQYALKAQAKDKATAAAAAKKLKEEKGYFIVPTGGETGLTPSGFIARGNEGRYVKLSNAQIDNLQNDADFNKNFTVLPGELWGDVVKEAMEPKEIAEKYLTTDDLEPMFTGSGDYYSFRVQYADANKLKKGEYLPPRYIGNAKTDLGKLKEIDNSVKKNTETFKEFAQELNKTGIDIPSQVSAKVVQGFRALGIDAGGGTTSIVQLQSILEKLAAENAAEILGESGKTLSDNDRAMVKRIIGEIKISFGESADKEQLVRKMGRLYGKIIGAQKRNLKSAASSLYNVGLTEASIYLDDESDPFRALGGLSTGLGDTTTTNLSMGPNGLLRLSLIEK